MPVSNVRVLPARRRRSQLTAASFFTGAGGLLLGFMRAGFDVQGSLDRKSIVARNLEANFPDLRHFRRDLHEMTKAEVSACFGEKPIDVVFGGPPCQGFSIFGRRRFVNTRGHDPSKDPLNELTIRYAKLAIALQPKVIFMENVKGFLSTPRRGGSYLSEVESLLAKAGYTVTHEVVNCAALAVPQLRERVILVATSRGVSFDWPEPKHFC